MISSDDEYVGSLLATYLLNMLGFFPIGIITSEETCVENFIKIGH